MRAPLGIAGNATRTPRRCADRVVVPDRGGQRQDALTDSGTRAGNGATAVLFHVQLTLEGVEDRLDALAQRLKTRSPARSASALRVGRSSSMPIWFRSASNSARWSKFLNHAVIA